MVFLFINDYFYNYSCLYNVLCCKKKCGNPEVLKTCLRKLKKTISEAATRFSGYHQHVRDILQHFFNIIGQFQYIKILT